MVRRRVTKTEKALAAQVTLEKTPKTRYRSILYSVVCFLTHFCHRSRSKLTREADSPASVKVEQPVLEDRFVSSF
jgi:hypothetical protein